MSELIDRSSLGTDDARLIRSYTTPSDVAEVLEVVEELRAPRRRPTRGMARRTSAPAGRRSTTRTPTGSAAVALAALWLLVGIGVIASVIVLVTAGWAPQSVAVWATTASLVSAAVAVGRRRPDRRA
ncbi:MAG TPA: hypothetical protein VIL36_05010 [Acidimicrobiales bacterium]